jgi:hypothetical protein
MVSRFEANLIQLTRHMLQQDMGDQLGMLIAGRQTMPKCLSANCVHLMKDTLGKSCILFLARAGGWRRERYLRDGQPVEGRIWQRSTADELRLLFSRHTLAFLVWLACGCSSDVSSWNPAIEELTAADQLLLFVAYGSFRDTTTMTVLRTKSAVTQNLLCRLYYPGDFAGVASPVTTGIWTHGVGSCILEAMQPHLLTRWLEMERSKAMIIDWEQMRRLGQSQTVVLDSLISSVAGAGRRDLVRFLLRLFNEFLTPDLTLGFWISGLFGTGPARLADRLETHRAALATLRVLEPMSQWTRQARGTAFYDESFAAAQLWLSDWEHFRGDEMSAIARRLLRSVEPLESAVPPPSGHAASGPGGSEGTAGN